MDDRARVAELLGRDPRGAFAVVVRDESGDPVVVRNAPFLDDGTPMPTRYYLVGADLVKAVSRIEAAGAVDEAEAAFGADVIAAIHRRYADERDEAIPAEHVGPRPSGGVGGTRVGVKCLHAHVAHHLATGDDAIGRWTLARVPVGTMGVPGDAEQMTPGSVRIDIDDRETRVEIVGGGTWRLPVGPLSLVENELERADRPAPEQLTNALGIVTDHLDDVVRESSSVLAAPEVAFEGHHATVLARVELGSDIPDDYILDRVDADEVFRTLVSESAADRVHNPGLDPDQVDTVIGTCCVVLAVMRRLELSTVSIVSTDPRS